jgi:alpha-N-arabinofuranosidase
MQEAMVVADPAFVVGPINRRLFGSFVEHLGRCVYDGIYEPGHESADAEGFRADVLELVRELGVTTIRYPGGNFVSGYRWEDGVGPRHERPARLDLAWHSRESNEIGLHEFARWNALVGSELMLAVNLGTRGTLEALDLLEYCNIRSGTALSDKRAADGTADSFDVRMWCLGNEMDGPWQLGHRNADDYGKIASRTAKAMRQLDPRVELVVCGSSSAAMPTFGAWERIVLEHCYEDVDFISCHAYYQERDGDLGSFLASAVDMDHFIETVVAAADHVKSVLRSEKTIQISFDEWNIWYQDRWEHEERITDIYDWPTAPRVLEDVYSVADAVVVGSLLISLLKHADRVAAASLAQLVNVIAPIMTEPGGPAWRQTTFFPFALTSRMARGEVLEVALDGPFYDTTAYGVVPLVDAVVTRDGDELAVFLVNRSQTDPVSVTVDVRGNEVLNLLEALTLSDADPRARNTLAEPGRVSPFVNTSAKISGGLLRIELPPISWSAISLGRDRA